MMTLALSIKLVDADGKVHALSTDWLDLTCEPSDITQAIRDKIREIESDAWVRLLDEVANPFAAKLQP